MRSLILALILILAAPLARADQFTLSVDGYGGLLVGTVDVTTTSSAATKLVYTFRNSTTTDTLTIVADAFDNSRVGRAKVRKDLSGAFSALANGGTVGLSLQVTQGGKAMLVPFGGVTFAPGYAALRLIDYSRWQTAIGPKLTAHGFSGAQSLQVQAALNDAGIAAAKALLASQTGDSFQ